MPHTDDSHSLERRARSLRPPLAFTGIIAIVLASAHAVAWAGPQTSPARSAGLFTDRSAPIAMTANEFAADDRDDDDGDGAPVPGGRVNESSSTTYWPSAANTGRRPSAPTSQEPRADYLRPRSDDPPPEPPALPATGVRSPLVRYAWDFGRAPVANAASLLTGVALTAPKIPQNVLIDADVHWEVRVNAEIALGRQHRIGLLLQAGAGLGDAVGGLGVEDIYLGAKWAVIEDETFALGFHGLFGLPVGNDPDAIAVWSFELAPTVTWVSGSTGQFFGFSLQAPALFATIADATGTMKFGGRATLEFFWFDTDVGAGWHTGFGYMAAGTHGGVGGLPDPGLSPEGYSWFGGGRFRLAFVRIGWLVSTSGGVFDEADPTVIRHRASGFYLHVGVTIALR